MDYVTVYVIGLVMGFWILSFPLRSARRETDFYRRQVMDYMTEVVNLRNELENVKEDFANGDGWKHA